MIERKHTQKTTKGTETQSVSSKSTAIKPTKTIKNNKLKTKIMARLTVTQEMADKVYTLKQAGNKNTDIKEITGINTQTISNILKGVHKMVPTQMQEPTTEEVVEETTEEVVEEVVEETTEEVTEETEVKAKLNLDIDVTNTEMFNTITNAMMKNVTTQLTEVSEQIKGQLEGLVNDVTDAKVQQLKPTRISFPNRETVEINETLHKDFEDCMFSLSQEKQLYMAGPAGTGKTTMAEMLAKGLGMNFGAISCTAGMSEAQLTGRMLFDGKFVTTQFLDIFENGGVFLFDEIDAADANLLLVINSALANGILSVPNRTENQTAVRHQDCYIVCAGNTWGAGSQEYHGRNYLDAAFIDRFSMSKVSVNYDEGLERIITNNSDICNTMQQIRENVLNSRMDRIVSTRTIVSAYRHTLAGKTAQEVVDRFTEDWTQEEKSKGLDKVSL